MNISKIIKDSLDKSLKEAANGKFDNYCNIDKNLVSQDAMLMNYIHILLSTYHKELKSELSKHGIEI